MREKPDQALDQKVLKVWTIVAAAEWLFLLLVPVGYWVATRYFPIPEWPLYVLAGLVILAGIFKIFIIPKMQWKRWRYKIYDNEVELMYGVFVIRRVIIPMIRVQHVDTAQGPLLRHYQLSAVTISTAATTHEIPGLDEEKANILRDHIAELAREADPDE
ncbi:PH domain-containing protein [Evansella sp. LMS18]|jgi:membrane protein YdbS with pleckstrin-like domain|uniref:PH domain-containing protein n=1 Tax=Evansella sp. LMS18 TaxID=2924033 RepID=UPI0020CFF798|nr:PH domain-containing protein [Evansella sp. LMS18]UTR09680.1 PH domain-containing protein [Evansella sp. LMS18]